MLIIEVPGTDSFNEQTNTFISTKGTTLKLEHSLVSIAKWESKWRVPYFSRRDMTIEQTVDYIKCMTITQNVDSQVYNTMPPSCYQQITDYIKSEPTATFIKDDGSGSSSQILTSELIYAYMFEYGVAIECQTWNIHRLLKVIQIISIHNQPKKKMKLIDVLKNNVDLNEKRKAELKTNG